MRRLAKLAVTGEFIVQALKGPSQLRRFRVKENALPDDAAIAWIEADERTVYLVIESEAFALVASNAIPELPPTVWETVMEKSA